MSTYSMRAAVKGVLSFFVLLATAALSFGEDGPDHEGGHPTKGPRGGVLVELGNEELHAELLHDDETGTVTVFMLDNEARRYVQVTAAELVIQIRHERQAQQFRLKAKPQKGDRAGLTSCFAIRDPRLVELLDDHHTEARMAIKIGERSFVGRIAHVHDHEHGDAHAH
ncbi:MAG: hypothetical protein AB7U20_17990 [Planctomycetaceae bacterium]